MNFEFSEEQKLLREMIRDFAEHEIAPVIKDLEDRHAFPSQILRKLGDLGVMGMTVPSEYGGTHTDYISLALALEELSRISPTVAVIVSVHCSLFAYSILKYGSPQQKEKYLPGAARGEIL